MQIYIDESGRIVNGLVANASESVPYFVLAALVLREGLPKVLLWSPEGSI